MVKSISIFVVGLIFGVVIYFPAYAAMKQSLKEATTYDMFLPKTSLKTSNTADKKVDPSINYNPAIARKLFNMSDGQKRTITIQDGITRAHVALGSKIRVVLENVENAQWYMECSEELVLINTKNEDDKIIMMFDTRTKGRANIYFDCVDTSDNSFKVIASKYINIIVD